MFGAQLFDSRRRCDGWQAALASNDEPIPAPLSLYVHVPFCASPCFYCGCNRIVTRDRRQAERYLADLAQEIALIVRGRAASPRWTAAMRRHGYKGAAEMAATVDFLFAFDATTGQVADHHYALVTDAYLNDPINREFLLHHNPQALRQIGQRLLQAAERGLWADADAHIPSIRQALLEAEMRLEGSSLDDETPFEIAQRPGSNL